MVLATPQPTGAGRSANDADACRRPRPKQDTDLARVHYTQMVERGANHLKALCLVRLAEPA